MTYVSIDQQVRERGAEERERGRACIPTQVHTGGEGDGLMRFVACLCVWCIHPMRVDGIGSVPGMCACIMACMTHVQAAESSLPR